MPFASISKPSDALSAPGDITNEPDLAVPPKQADVGPEIRGAWGLSSRMVSGIEIVRLSAVDAAADESLNNKLIPFK